MTTKRITRRSSSMFPHITDWLASKERKITYCAAHNLPLPVFNYWLKRYRDQVDNSSPDFVEIQSPSELNSSGWIRIRDHRGIEVELAGGISATFLRDLLSW